MGVSGAAKEGGHFVLDGAWDDELRAEPAKLGEAVGIGHPIGHIASMRSTHSLTATLLFTAFLQRFSEFRFYAVISFSGSPGTSPTRHVLDTPVFTGVHHSAPSKPEQLPPHCDRSGRAGQRSDAASEVPR
jgi:hypothetical protein